MSTHKKSGEIPMDFSAFQNHQIAIANNNSSAYPTIPGWRNLPLKMQTESTKIVFQHLPEARSIDWHT
jgi:hypothetical protein